MSEAQTEISLLGQNYTVLCSDEEASTLTIAAQYLDDALLKIQQKSSERRAERLALMAALNITHELINERTQLALLELRAKQLNRQITQKIEQLNLTE